MAAQPRLSGIMKRAKNMKCSDCCKNHLVREPSFLNFRSKRRIVPQNNLENNIADHIQRSHGLTPSKTSNPVKVIKKGTSRISKKNKVYSKEENKEKERMLEILCKL